MQKNRDELIYICRTDDGPVAFNRLEDIEEIELYEDEKNVVEVYKFVYKGIPRVKKTIEIK